MVRVSCLARQLVRLFSVVLVYLSSWAVGSCVCVAGVDLGSGVIAGLKRGISLQALRIPVSLGGLHIDNSVGQAQKFKM